MSAKAIIENNLVTRPEHAVPVLARADVIVVGGSPTGVAAAVAAARGGAQVVLVERFGFLGGQMTAGLMITMHRPYWDAHSNRIVGGIPVEMMKRAMQLGGTVDPLDLLEHEGPRYWRKGWTGTPIDPEVNKRVLQEMICEAGVKTFLDVWVSGVVMSEQKVQGVIIETRSGSGALLAPATVDATGDAHIAALAGAKFEMRGPNRFAPNLPGRMDGLEFAPLADYVEEHFNEFDSLPAPADFSAQELGEHIRAGRVFGLIGFSRLAEQARRDGMPLPPDQKFGFYHIRDGQCMLWRNNLAKVDTLNAEELSKAYLECRKRMWNAVEFYRAYVPGCKNVRVIDTAPAMGIRETRRIVGDYTITEEDVLTSRRFPEVVCRSIGHDQHLNLKDGACDIPYGALLPQGIEGLLVAGRSISCTAPKALDAIRGVVPCASMGQSTGVAAALAAQMQITPRQVPLEILQTKLQEQGVIL